MGVLKYQNFTRNLNMESSRTKFFFRKIYFFQIFAVLNLKIKFFFMKGVH